MDYVDGKFLVATGSLLIELLAQDDVSPQKAIHFFKSLSLPELLKATLLEQHIAIVVEALQTQEASGLDKFRLSTAIKQLSGFKTYVYPESRPLKPSASMGRWPKMIKLVKHEGNRLTLGFGRLGVDVQVRSVKRSSNKHH